MPRLRKDPRRRRTRFGRFIDGVGVGRLAQELEGLGVGVSRHALYGWLSGRIRPRPEAAMALRRLSKGELEIEDIYRHHDRMRKTRPG